MRRQGLFVSCVATLGMLGAAPAAFAGEGGVAGAAAFTLNSNGDVNSVAVAAAVGKNNAYANATSATANLFGTPIFFNNAQALGSAGTVTGNLVTLPDELLGIQIGSVSGGVDGSLGTAQGNTFSKGADIDIDVNVGIDVDGTTIVFPL